MILVCLMDVQFGSIDWNKLHLPASSQDAGVATGVTVNVDKVLPVANKEESHEQETEEDSLSTTSTIDYDFEYTDEKYSSTSDDEDGSTVSNNNYLIEFFQISFDAIMSSYKKPLEPQT
ncbi:hypothetical protein MKW92_018403 [Papaver armeniacum]|nr:hypothetical protein MKW92_018403 [Papaver armeniacum]